jgi:hypothetical protein
MTTRAFALVWALAMLAPCVGFAAPTRFRLGMGAGAMDAGDGRFRPAALLEAGFPDYGSLRSYAYGYRAGTVSQFGSAASLTREWRLTKDVRRARAGVAYLREQTRIRQTGAPTLDSVSHNAGLAFGFRAQGTLGSVFAALDWQNDCYVAGSNALLGSFGRRQFLTLEWGVDL